MRSECGAWRRTLTFQIKKSYKENTVLRERACDGGGGGGKCQPVTHAPIWRRLTIDFKWFANLIILTILFCWCNGLACLPQLCLHRRGRDVGGVGLDRLLKAIHWTEIFMTSLVLCGRWVEFTERLSGFCCFTKILHRRSTHVTYLTTTS